MKRKPNRYSEVTVLKKIFLFIRFAAKKICSGFYVDDQICKTSMHYLLRYLAIVVSVLFVRFRCDRV